MQVITAASEAGAAGPAPSVSAMAQPTTEEPVLLQFWGLARLAGNSHTGEFSGLYHVSSALLVKQ